MAEDTFDPFALSTGLPDKFEGTVTEPYFAFNPEVNNGETLLFMIDVKTDDNELGEDGVVSLRFPCGAGWEAAEKGQLAVREDGKKKGFNQNSGMGNYVEALMGSGAVDDLRAKADEHGPMRATLTEGMKFFWERKDYASTINGEEAKWSRTLPVKYLGNGKGSSSKPAAATGKPVKESPDAEGDETPTATGGVDPGLLAKIKVRAKKAETHDEFMVLCFDELQPLSPEAEAIIMDETGLWAEVKG